MDKIRKAAIILLGMGEDYAEHILKNMSKAEVHKIMEAVNTIDNVSEDDVIIAMNEFFTTSDNAGIDIVSREQIKNSIVSVLGIKGLEKIDIEKSKWMELLKFEPLDSVMELLQDEHPQVLTAIIVILTQLGSTRATEIMKGQSKEMQGQIIKRMSVINPISIFSLDVLSIFFENELSAKERYGVVTIDGVDAAANLIANLDGDTEREIIASLASSDSALAEQIQDKLLPFERLATLDSKSMQTLLKEISSDDLVLALKGSNEHLRNVIMKNISAKAAEILKDDMDAKGPVKITNVLEAQRRIVLMAKKLSKEEKIILSTKSESDVVF